MEKNKVIVGLQQAGISGAPLASQPETWDTSSTADFKELFDQIGAASGASPSTDCQQSDACGQAAHAFAIDAGFYCNGEDGNLYAHWGSNKEAQLLKQGKDVADELTLIVDGDTFYWYVNSDLAWTQEGVQHNPYDSLYTPPYTRSGSALRPPMWVVALVHNGGGVAQSEDCVCMTPSMTRPCHGP